MSLGLIGTKCGMTRIFTDEGAAIPVTVLDVSEHFVVQVKSSATDKYNAVQVTTGAVKPSRVTKPLTGHYQKANVAPGTLLREFRVDGDASEQFKTGDTLHLEMFSVGQKIDVTGVSKGKGFAGTVKRYNFAMQDATHGNSLSHRVPGSIGQCQYPGRVFKGKKMPGRMGNKRCTIQSLEIVDIQADKNILLVRGAVPGPNGGKVMVRPAAKHPAPEQKGDA